MIKIKITIEEDGGTSTSEYSGDYYSLHIIDWEDRIRYSLDDFMPEDTPAPEIPGFEGTRESIEKLWWTKKELGERNEKDFKIYYEQHLPLIEGSVQSCQDHEERMLMTKTMMRNAFLNGSHSGVKMMGEEIKKQGEVNDRKSWVGDLR